MKKNIINLIYGDKKINKENFYSNNTTKKRKDNISNNKEQEKNSLDLKSLNFKMEKRERENKKIIFNLSREIYYLKRKLNSLNMKLQKQKNDENFFKF